MAIPQQSNAVFYHPLDDASEALQGSSWDSSAAFAGGKVANAAYATAGGGLTIGPAQEVTAAGGAESYAALDSEKFAVGYNNCMVRIGAVGEDMSITWGTERNLAGLSVPAKVAKLSSTTFVALWEWSADVHAIACGLSGMDVTLLGGSATTVASSLQSALGLSATTFMIVYGDLRARSASVLAGSITWYSEYEFDGVAELLL